jgi:hypothetical protein
MKCRVAMAAMLQKHYCNDGGLLLDGGLPHHISGCCINYHWCHSFLQVFTGALLEIEGTNIE